MIFRNIFSVTLIKCFITLSHLIFGLAIAKYYGASAQMDAYVAASGFIIALNAIFFRSQRKTFIPFIANYSNNKRYKDIIGSVIKTNFFIFTGLSLLIFVLSRYIVIILAPGLEPSQHVIASKILKILSVYILFTNLCGIGIGISENKFKFRRTALLLLLESIIALSILVILNKILSIYSIPIAHSVSLTLSVLIYIYLIKKDGYKLSSKFSIWNEYISNYFKLMLPVLVGAVFVWLIRFADTFIASFLPEGSISYLSYCQRIITYIAFIPSTVCIIYFPILSNFNKEKNSVHFIKNLYEGLQTIFTLNLVFSLFILIYAAPIISLVFERGNFSHGDTLIVSKVMICYFFVFIGGPIGTFLSDAYYSQQRPMLGTIYSVISSITNIVLNFIFGYLYGIFGIAIASSIAFFIGNTLQIYNIKRVNTEYRLSKSIKKILGPTIAGAISIGITILIKNFLWIQSNTAYLTFVNLLIHFLLFSLIYLFTCYILKVDVVILLIRKSKKQLMLAKKYLKKTD